MCFSFRSSFYILCCFVSFSLPYFCWFKSCSLTILKGIWYFSFFSFLFFCEKGQTDPVHVKAMKINLFHWKTNFLIAKRDFAIKDCAAFCAFFSNRLHSKWNFHTKMTAPADFCLCLYINLTKVMCLGSLVVYTFT